MAQRGPLAWDKHDFSVANNKGGDVTVAVNLAAPMNRGNHTHHKRKLLKSIMDLVVEQRAHRVNITQMMDQFVTGLKEYKPHEEVNIKELISDLKSVVTESLKESKSDSTSTTTTNTHTVTYLPAQAPPIPMVPIIIEKKARPVIPPTPPAGKIKINVEHQLPPPPPAVPPPPATPPIDTVQLVKEVVNTIVHQVPMQQPQPAHHEPDPLLVSQIQELRQMVQSVVEKTSTSSSETHTVEHAPSPALPPQIIVNVPPMPAINIPPFPLPPPPPPPSFVSSTSVSREELRQMISHSSPPPIVTLPTPPQNREIEELRQLIISQKQEMKQIAPIVLPPPRNLLSSSKKAQLDRQPEPESPPPLPPIPRPAPSQDMSDMFKAMVPAPARIPAPPVFNITQAPAIIVQPCVNCNSPPPPPESIKRVDEEVKCERVEGSPTPRCKKAAPKGVKCKRKGTPLKVVGEEPVGGADEGETEECEQDDIAIQGSQDAPSSDCPDCDRPGQIKHSDFNPKKLLQRLCAGGKCPEFDDRAAVVSGDIPPQRTGGFPNGGFMDPHVGSL